MSRGSPTAKKQKRRRSPSPSPVREGDDSRTPKRQRSTSDSSDRTPPRKTVTTTTRERGRAASYTRTPPTRQDQRRDTRTVPRGIGPDRGYSPPPREPESRWPQVGVDERTGPEHHRAVRSTSNLDNLWPLWTSLARDEPHRTALINTVERQVIRAELHAMMGGPIATRANIIMDGRPKTITSTHDSKSFRQADVRVSNGTHRQNTVWNTSVHDTEVDTIRDVRNWAQGLSAEQLRDARDIVIQIVGTSGPCEACKDRLRFMVNDIEDEWHNRTGIPKSELPNIQLWSYYGNPPEVHDRGPYRDVLNGWDGDVTPADLTFVNRNNRNQLVREHQIL